MLLHTAQILKVIGEAAPVWGDDDVSAWKLPARPTSVCRTAAPPAATVTHQHFTELYLERSGFILFM